MVKRKHGRTKYGKQTNKTIQKTKGFCFTDIWTRTCMTFRDVDHGITLNVVYLTCGPKTGQP